jgi:CYTH domain-containing protein
MKKLVYTGGPCAGKTTGLAYTQEKLLNRGFHPLIVPEAPTLLMLGNAIPSVYPERTFQHAVVKTMSDLEDTFERIAQSRPELNPVLICDRGIQDAEPYMSDGLYEKILAELGLGTPTEVRDRRYDGVYHLCSAAVGAEEFYTTANNIVRRETVEEARKRDAATLSAWTGHPHLRVIDNSTDFAGKLRRLDQHLCRALGIPVPLEIENKYVCRPVCFSDISVPCKRIDIEQAYLFSAEGKGIRVRKRGQYGSYVYYRTEKTELRPGVRIETEDFITVQEYAWSLKFLEPGRRIIQKERWCFVWESQYFELDLIPRNHDVLYLLEIELTEENDEVKLPPFISVVKEVTSDPFYSNYNLAAA